MLVFSAGSLLTWLAPNLAWLIVGRIVQALGAGSALTISRVVAADLFAGSDLAKVFAYMTMAIVVAPWSRRRWPDSWPTSGAGVRYCCSCCCSALARHC
jgi:hypothetical protein